MKRFVKDIAWFVLPVVFLLDRSGIGGEDGQTHHGLFDFSITLPVPGITVLAPSSSGELTSMLKWSATYKGPCVIRYPKSVRPFRTEDPCKPFVRGQWEQLTEGNKIVLLATGSMVARAMEVYQIMQEEQLS